MRLTVCEVRLTAGPTTADRAPQIKKIQKPSSVFHPLVLTHTNTQRGPLEKKNNQKTWSLFKLQTTVMHAVYATVVVRLVQTRRHMHLVCLLMHVTQGSQCLAPICSKAIWTLKRFYKFSQLTCMSVVIQTRSE